MHMGREKIKRFPGGRIIGTDRGMKPTVPSYSEHDVLFAEFYGLKLRRGAGDAMAREEAQDLHLFRQLEQEFLIPFEMMNRCRSTARELAHGLDVFPIGNRHELSVVFAVLAERLDTQHLVEERLDAGFIVVGFVLIGAVTRGSPAPDADNGGLLGGRGVHDTLLLWDDRSSDDLTARWLACDALFLCPASHTSDKHGRRS